MIWVKRAKVKDGYKFWLEFNDGSAGIVDLDLFRRGRVELDTLSWDNGIDFAPEYLYEIAKLNN